MNLEKNILNYLLEKKRLSFKELSVFCGVSIPTIRKFSSFLETKGLVRYVYGGIEISDDSLDSSNHSSEADDIAAEAVKLICDGDTIFLGPGTTVHAICSHLDNFNDLTVFTNSLPVINSLSANKKIVLYTIGGLFQRANKAFSLYGNQFEKINISKAFIGASAIDPDIGISHQIPENMKTEEIISKHAKRVILLATKKKFEIQKTFVVMPISIIDTLISSKGLSPALIDKFTKKGITVILG